ncbi:MAG: type II toxin-antitoxin system Phd/YefM family antitoxin [Longimicrobiales bacterium]
MRAGGVREVRNRFSEYLRVVAEGETVLVTDRGRVVAQLAPPPVVGCLWSRKMKR